MVFFQTASIRHIIGRQHSHIIRLRHYAVSVKLTVNALTAHMTGEQLDIQGKLKPVERRLTALKKHLEQSDIYFKCKGKKPLTEAEQILFITAHDYLKGVMNGNTALFWAFIRPISWNYSHNSLQRFSQTCAISRISSSGTISFRSYASAKIFTNLCHFTHIIVRNHLV